VILGQKKRNALPLTTEHRKGVLKEWKTKAQLSKFGNTKPNVFNVARKQTSKLTT